MIRKQNIWYSFIYILAMLVICYLIISPLFPPGKISTHLSFCDASINTYLINWGHHALLKDPLHFYNAPLLYPQKTSAAFSSLNVFMIILTLPLHLTHNPVLVFNLCLILGIFLTAISMFALIYYLTRHNAAAAVAGIIYSSNGDMIAHLSAGHPNIISPFFLPGIIGFYIEFRRGYKTKYAIIWGLCIIGQFLCCFYLGFISLIGMSVFIAVDLIFYRKTINRKMLLLPAVLIVCMGVVFIFSSPYRQVSKRLGSTRSLNAAMVYSLDPIDYLLPNGPNKRNPTITGELLGKFTTRKTVDENSQFYGYLPMLLSIFVFSQSLYQLIRKKIKEESKLLLALAFMGFAGFMFSLSPFLYIFSEQTTFPMPFKLLFDYVPPLRFFRVPGRFALLVVFFISVAVSFFIVNSRLFNSENFIKKSSAYILLIFLLIFEYIPVSTSGLRKIDPVSMDAVTNHKQLKTIAAFPFFDNHNFLVDSAKRFPYTPNGYYGGVINYYYSEIVELLKKFPDEKSLSVLTALGVDGVAVYNKNLVAKTEECSSLSLMKKWTNGGLYLLNYNNSEKINEAKIIISSIPERPVRPSFKNLDLSDPKYIVFRYSKESKHPNKLYKYKWEVDCSYFPGAYYPTKDIAKIYIKMAANMPGMDFTMTRVSYTTDKFPKWSEQQSISQVFFPDGSDNLLEFDFSKIPDWENSGTLHKLHFYFIRGSYPGLEIHVKEIIIEKKAF